MPFLLVFSLYSIFSLIALAQSGPNDNLKTFTLQIPDAEFEKTVEAFGDSSCPKGSECKKCCKEKQNECSVYASKEPTKTLSNIFASQARAQIIVERTMESKVFAIQKLSNQSAESQKADKSLKIVNSSDSPCSRNWRNKCEAICQE